MQMQHTQNEDIMVWGENAGAIESALIIYLVFPLQAAHCRY